MAWLRALWRRIAGYFGVEPPRLGIGATVALIVVGNQPFYPLYVSYVAGFAVWPSLLTWLSTPFFVAVPAVMRRNPQAGRVLLLATAVLNTVLTAKALGAGSGVELFYLPTVLLAAVMTERARMPLTLLGTFAASAAGMALARFDAAPLVAFDAAQDRGLVKMHAISVACLCFVIIVMTVRARRSGAAGPVSRNA